MRSIKSIAFPVTLGYLANYSVARTARAASLRRLSFLLYHPLINSKVSKTIGILKYVKNKLPDPCTLL